MAAEPGQESPSTWEAVLWAEVLALGGLVPLAIAYLSSSEWCAGSLGCEQESSGGSFALPIAAIALLPLLGSAYVAAGLSGRSARGRMALLAVGAFVVVLLVVAGPLGRNYPTALAAALTALAAIAVRPPSRRAVWARAAVVGSLVALALIVSAPTAVLLVLVAMPSIGLADALARRATA